MKRELTHCHLRFATTERYDPVPRPARNYVVEQAVEDLVLDEPRSASRGNAAKADALSRAPAAISRRARQAEEQQAELQRQTATVHRISANPFREEPHPALVNAVRRFGFVGLLAGALGAAGARFWRTLFR